MLTGRWINFDNPGPVLEGAEGTLDPMASRIRGQSFVGKITGGLLQSIPSWPWIEPMHRPVLSVDDQVLGTNKGFPCKAARLERASGILRRPACRLRVVPP